MERIKMETRVLGDIYVLEQEMHRKTKQIAEVAGRELFEQLPELAASDILTVTKKIRDVTLMVVSSFEKQENSTYETVVVYRALEAMYSSIFYLLKTVKELK